MAYKRYQGNSGRVERVPTPEDAPEDLPPPPAPGTGPPEAPPPPPPGPLRPPPGRAGGLDELLSRFDPGSLSREDWLVLGLLWLLYRLSGETEYLIAMGAYLFL